jgi:hypothetical protein
MFGALMGTLNSFQKQSLNSKSVEKRAEIDARVKKRVLQEKEELEADRERNERERKQRDEETREAIEKEAVCIQ